MHSKFKLLFIIGLVVVFYSCKKEKSELILGKWSLVAVDGIQNSDTSRCIEIKEDGLFMRTDWVHIHQTHYELKSLNGTWLEMNDTLTFKLNDQYNVTVMVNGIDSSYQIPCGNQWKLLEVSKDDLLLSHEIIDLGCFQDTQADDKIYRYAKME